MISKDKKYKTQAGNEVKIYSVDDSNYGVHGAFKDGYKWYSYTWNTDGGCMYGYSNLNLVEVKEKIKIDRWINVYETGKENSPPLLDDFHFTTKKLADIYSKTIRYKRVACVKVTIDCEPGQGL